VRLQGGDPLIFGRAAEEIAALRKADVDFEIVPGVTSALGAAAAAQVSLTERRVASSVIFTTGHRCDPNNSTAWPAATAPRAELRPTVVVYMATDYASIAKELQGAGWERETPCLLVSSVGTPQETSFLTLLSALPDAPQLPTPRLLIIGAVVKTASLGKTLAAQKLHGAPTLCRPVSW
jgi:siroheme synthase